MAILGYDEWIGMHLSKLDQSLPRNYGVVGERVQVRS